MSEGNKLASGEIRARALHDRVTLCAFDICHLDHAKPHKIYKEEKKGRGAPGVASQVSGGAGATT